MSQHNFSIQNSSPPALSGIALVNAINSALQALASESLGATEPGTIYAGQIWHDTTNNLVKKRNAANNAWVPLYGLSGTTFTLYNAGAAITTVGAALFAAASQAAGRTAIGLGTAAVLNVGTGANQIVQLDGTAKLPAVDGSQLLNVTGIPIGTVIDFAGATLPAAFLWCAGQNVSRTTYAALFAAIGTTHGVGDGSTTFGIPDLRGRVAVGRDDMGGSAASRVTAGVSGITGTTLGAVGGAQAFTPTIAKMAAHTHGVTAHVTDSPNDRIGSGKSSQPTTGGATNSEGGGGVQETMPPAMILNKIIFAGV